MKVAGYARTTLKKKTRLRDDNYCQKQPRHMTNNKLEIQFRGGIIFFVHTEISAMEVLYFHQYNST